MIYIKLFLNFFMIGALSFGGGYGMISLVRDTVLSNGWLTESEFHCCFRIYSGIYRCQYGNFYRLFAGRDPGRISGNSRSGPAVILYYSADCRSFKKSYAMRQCKCVFVWCSSLRGGNDPGNCSPYGTSIIGRIHETGFRSDRNFCFPPGFTFCLRIYDPYRNSFSVQKIPEEKSLTNPDDPAVCRAWNSPLELNQQHFFN